MMSGNNNTEPGRKQSLNQSIEVVKDFLGSFEKYGDPNVASSIWRLLFISEAAAAAFRLGKKPGLDATSELYDCGYDLYRLRDKSTEEPDEKAG